MLTVAQKHTLVKLVTTGKYKKPGENLKTIFASKDLMLPEFIKRTLAYMQQADKSIKLNSAELPRLLDEIANNISVTDPHNKPKSSKEKVGVTQKPNNDDDKMTVSIPPLHKMIQTSKESAGIKESTKFGELFDHLLS